MPFIAMITAAQTGITGTGAAPGGSLFADWLREHLPSWLERQSFMLENWQWLGISLLVLAGMIVDRILRWVFRYGLHRSLARVGVRINSDLAGRTLRPFGLLVAGIFWSASLGLLGLPEQPHGLLRAATSFIIAFTTVWGAYRIVDVLAETLSQRAARTSSKFDDLLVPLVRKSLKIFVTVFGLVFIADNLGTDIGSLLAGLGIGGLAIALAAKDTVNNLFGTLTVLTDRPFDVGDWIVIGAVEGTVEAVGFRSTRIRTFYNSLVTVPNGQILNSSIDNLGVRRWRRWKCHLAITYGTAADQIEAFCEGIRELIRLHPYTRKDYFHVYLNSFADSSLNILLYTFFGTPDWSTELRERHRLALDILRLARRLGVEFAFPTQTLHLFSEEVTELSGEAHHPRDEGGASAAAAGALAARAIVEETMGGLGVTPPPVTSEVPDGQDRGEGDG